MTYIYREPFQPPSYQDDILECPKCGKRHLVRKNTTSYHCLACGFNRDISEPDLQGVVPLFGMVFGATVLTLVLLSPREPATVQPSPTPTVSSALSPNHLSAPLN